MTTSRSVLFLAGLTSLLTMLGRTRVVAKGRGRWMAGLLMATALGVPALSQTAHLSGTPVTLGSGFNRPFSVAVDGTGNIYIADTDNKAVKKVPYSGGSYGTPVVLGSGFGNPFGVAVDGAGNVYVTDSSVNNLVEEIPYSGGSYGTPVVLGSGFNSPTGIAVDSAGNLYVAETGIDAIKKIPYVGGGSYGTPVQLGSGFNSPFGVAVDAAGNVYVADYGNNAIKQIPYSGGSYYAPVTLSSTFRLPYGVAVDDAGNVYVADSANKAVKKIPYSGGSYDTPVELGSGFGTPLGVAVDGAGNVYVADIDNNAVKKLQMTLDFGAADVGTAATGLVVTFGIDSAGSLGTPVVLTQGAGGQDFTDAGTGTCSTNGRDYLYNAGDLCTVEVNFKPTSPGARLGAVQLVSSSGAVLATAFLLGTGNGAQVTFPPGLPPETLGSGFLNPYDVAVDGGGNVYVADGGNNTIKKIPYSGGSYGTPVTLGGGFASPTGVVVDGAGNVYVADFANKALKKVPYSGGSYGTPVTLGSGFSFFYGVAVDGAGNIYIADTDNKAVKKVPYSGGSYGAPVTLGSGFSYPAGIAVDGAGNIFVADPDNNTVQEIPYSGGSYGTPVTLGGGFRAPYGVAVDGASNVYVADYGNSAIKKIPYSGGSYGTPVTLGSGFRLPYGVAVDGAGNVFVADTSNNAVRKINLAAAPSLTFADTAVGTASAAQTVTVSNTGNQSLTFPTPPLGSNPGLSAGFSLDGSSTCPQLTSSSFSAGVLEAGASCTEILAFAPVTAGVSTGLMVLTDNAGNPSSTTNQNIRLGGTATRGTPALRTPPTASPVTYGQKLASSTLTGGVASTAGTFAWSNPATQPAVGTAPYQVTFTPADTTSYATATLNVSVVTNKAPTVSTLSASPAAINPNQSVTLTANVASTTTGTPGGSVTFYDNGNMLQQVPLTMGTASYLAALGTPGANALTVTYSGDANFLGSSAVAASSVNVAPLDFSFSATAGPSSQTVAPGAAANYTFNIAPLYGAYAGPVTFTVSGLPAGATATFSPSTIVGGASPQTVKLSVQTSASVARNDLQTPFQTELPLMAFLLLPLAGSRKLRRGSLRVFLWVLLAAGLGGAASLTGCGSSSSSSTDKPPVGYTLVVTATGGPVQHTQAVTLVIEPR